MAPLRIPCASDHIARRLLIQARADLPARVGDFSQAENGKESQIHPADVEFIPLSLEFRGVRIGMMVVMQLLATQPDRDRGDVAALILDVEVPVADRVTHTIYDSGRPEWDPHHLNAPNDWADEKAEQIDVDGQHHQNAYPVEWGEEMPLEPVVRGPFSILVEDSRLTNRLSIVEGAFQHDVPQSFHERAVRIPFAICERVVLSMTCHPFLGDDGCREPQPEPHWQGCEEVQLDSTMGLSPVQKERNGHIGEVSSNYYEKNRLPPSRCPASKIRHYLLQ